MRIISGGTKLIPLRELYKETGLSKLKDRRENHKLIQLFKMQNDLAPASLSTLIPNRFQDMHTYNTRHSNAFPLPRTRTSLYASYFLPSTLKLWNSLPPEIKDCINIFRKVNDFYRIHKTQIHHVIFYLECNLQFSFFLLLPLIFSYLNNVKWIEYVLMTICNFSCVFF